MDVLLFQVRVKARFAEVLFSGEMVPSLTIPSPSIAFTPSLSECHDVWVAASSSSQLWGVCPECSLLSGDDGSCGCYSDPPMTHSAVDISKWKYIIPGWGSNLARKARGRWQEGCGHSVCILRQQQEGHFCPKTAPPNPITSPEK